jgi:hypothetical protein
MTGPSFATPPYRELLLGRPRLRLVFLHCGGTIFLTRCFCMPEYEGVQMAHESRCQIFASKHNHLGFMPLRWKFGSEGRAHRL